MNTQHPDHQHHRGPRNESQPFGNMERPTTADRAVVDMFKSLEEMRRQKLRKEQIMGNVAKLEAYHTEALTPTTPVQAEQFVSNEAPLATVSDIDAHRQAVIEALKDSGVPDVEKAAS